MIHHRHTLGDFHDLFVIQDQRRKESPVVGATAHDHTTVIDSNTEKVLRVLWQNRKQRTILEQRSESL